MQEASKKQRRLVKMKTKKWLLIDFDNTQMATEALGLPSLIQRFNDLYGQQIRSAFTIEEFQKYFHGQAREILCTNLSKHYGISVDYQLLYEGREWHVMSTFQKTGVQMAKNLVETLEQLQKQEFQFAFVSNNPIQRALAAMRYATNGQGERLARLFGTHYFEAYDKQKPLRDVYLRAMEQLQITPKDCYAIEDSPSGVKASVSAGIETFGYLEFTSNSQELQKRLMANGVSICFSDWKKLPSLLKPS